MPDIGVPELIIIAVIVLLLFGPGKAADLGASLGKGIREFRKATRDDDEPRPSTGVLAAAAGPGVASDAPSGQGTKAGRSCTKCGTPAFEGQKFCTKCGAALAVPMS